MLSGRKNTGKTEGTISFGGAVPSNAFLRRFTGYVEQFDTLLGTLTVREMLLYTAEMKRSIKEPYAEKAAAVDAAIEKLGLEVCKDVIIGGKEKKGISGGQAKRVNIGLAFITSPRVLFLDEPTSGLDSFTANEVMTTVKEIAKSGNVTVVTTIHSPTRYAFSLFDNLLMLSRGQAGPGSAPPLRVRWLRFHSLGWSCSRESASRPCSTLNPPRAPFPVLNPAGGLLWARQGRSGLRHQLVGLPQLAARRVDCQRGGVPHRYHHGEGPCREGTGDRRPLLSAAFQLARGCFGRPEP